MVSLIRGYIWSLGELLLKLTFTCRICWSFNNLCSQSCLLHSCYYFSAECCVRVPHFNYTANKASSLPWVSPVANQCYGKDSKAIHHPLLCCAAQQGAKWATEDLGRTAEWGSCSSAEREESRVLGSGDRRWLPAPCLLSHLQVFSQSKA